MANSTSVKFLNQASRAAMEGVVEVICLLAFIPGVIYGLMINTKKWMCVDATLTFVFGVCTIPFAVKSQQMQTTGVPVDPVHGFLCNTYICYCLMPAIAFLMLRPSADPTITTALLLSRTVGAGLATVVIAYGHFSTDIFNSMHLVYGVFGNAAWTVVNAFHLFQDGRVNKKGMTTYVDVYLKMDMAIALSYGIPELLLPDFILGFLAGIEPDTLHLHLLQVGAGIHIGTAALSYLALRFKSPKHKKAVLLSRIIIMLLMWVIRTHSWVFLEKDTTFFTYFMACLGYLPFFPAYVGIRTKD